MRINLSSILIFLLLVSSSLFSKEIELGGNRLDIRESSGRFRLYAENDKGNELPLLSDGDPRTSSFSVYEDNAFYTLGDSFRFRRQFSETDLGGIFTWESKSLYVIQEYELSYDGELKLSFKITNSSEAPLKTGLRILFDCSFEDEKRFVLSSGGNREIINSEYELSNTEDLEFISTGALSGKGKGLMIYPLNTNPDRLIMGNWDILDDSDYYYRSVEGRNFNNPPYSINDSAILFLYSPRDVLPGNTVGYSLILKVIESVESPDQIPSPVIATEKAETAQETIAEDNLPVDTDIKTEPEPESEPEQSPEPVESEPETPEVPIAEAEEIPEIEDAAEESPVAADVPEPPPAPAAASTVAEDDDNEPGDSDATKSQVKVFIEQTLESVEEIHAIIESLSKPGMLTDSNLTRLEELIEQLEKLKIDENTQ